ncbi:MAG TPA: PAS domain-containing protein [Ramlibacter sp.]|nr:PAS domain-containing protein [Ramlibacter sp.]
MTPNFLSAAGEVAELMRGRDWSGSELGTPAAWPQALQTVVSLMLHSTTPMYVAWGPQLRMLYNDAYRSILGDKHPASLSAPLPQVWPEIWDYIGPLFRRTLQGEAMQFENVGVTIRRHGFDEHAWFSFAYSPVYEGDGIAGLFCLITETTQRVVAERTQSEEYGRLRQWFEQAPGLMAVLHGPRHVVAVANRAYQELLGRSQLVGLAVRDAVPELEGQGFFELLDRVYATGEAYVGKASPAFLRREGALQERFFDFVYQPIRDAAGAVTGIFVQGVDVTEATQVGAALRVSEEKLRAATEGGGIGTWEMDLRSGTGHWSARGARMLGMDRQQFTADDWMMAVHPQDRERAAAAWQRSVQQGTPYEIEFRTTRPARDGGDCWVLSRGLIQRDAQGLSLRAAGVLFDATRRLRAQKALSEQRARERAYLDHLPLGVWFLDAEGQVIYVNQEAERIWRGESGGGPAPFQQHRGWWHGTDRPVEPADWASVRAVRHGETSLNEEIDIACGDGSRKTILNSAVPVRAEDGRVTGAVILNQDVTQAKRIEVGMREAEQALRAADRRKDEFLATLAHELRNPMAPIRNGLAILRVPGLAEGARERMLDLMERQVRHMVRLVDDLLEVSRITRGKIDLRREIVDLRAVVQGCLDAAQPQLQAAQHQLAVHLPAGPVLVDADGTRIAQVLDNLLNNAVKYTPEGGHLVVRLAQHDGWGVLSVEDDGTGIPPEMLDQVFDLFAQVDRTLGRARGGLGIGLALVRQLVQMHGGTVRAESRGIGEGARFTVRLPLLGAMAVPEPARPGSTLQPGRRGWRVLVVDDNRDAADSLAMVLEAAGHQVRTAYDGPDALGRAGEFDPQWVLLDIGMPGMNGHEVARALRARPGGDRLKLVAVTGWGQEDDRRLTRESGFDAHLVKPVEPEAIVKLLE